MGLAESYRNNGSAPGVDGLDKLYPGTPGSLSLSQHSVTMSRHCWQACRTHAMLQPHLQSVCARYIPMLAVRMATFLSAWLQAGPLIRWSLQATRTLWLS